MTCSFFNKAQLPSFSSIPRPKGKTPFWTSCQRSLKSRLLPGRRTVSRLQTLLESCLHGRSLKGMKASFGSKQYVTYSLMNSDWTLQSQVLLEPKPDDDIMQLRWCENGELLSVVMDSGDVTVVDVVRNTKWTRSSPRLEMSIKYAEWFLFSPNSSHIQIASYTGLIPRLTCSSLQLQKGIAL